MGSIRWRIRTGSPWRDVPSRYGSWQRVHGLFRAWQRDGTWAQILAELQGLAEAKDLITWEVSVDSTINRHITTPPAPAPIPQRRRSPATSPPTMPWAVLAAA